jgi:acetyl-CoA C-acetyltransferase
MVGFISNPRGQVDIAIVHGSFTINELLSYEDLGFSQRGKTIMDINDRFFEYEGVIVNSDGGLKCFGHPLPV